MAGTPTIMTRLAALQFFATPFALERNLQIAERLIREAAAQGAQVVVLPELFNTGYVYTPRLFEAAETADGPTVNWLKRLSAELKVVVGGAMLLREGGDLYDAFVLADVDGRISRYRKQHPFLWERCFFRPGDSPPVVATSVGRIGLLVCWDAAFRSAWEALRGRADLVLVSSAPPRFHRAVLNFPEARKVYVSELMPSLLPLRDAIDDWYLGGIGNGAKLTGAPVASAVMAGRFVTGIPFPRLSFALASGMRPRYWSWAGRAGDATLRATFYGCSAVFAAGGGALAVAAGEEGTAMAETTSGVAVSPESAKFNKSEFLFPQVPSQIRRLDSILTWPAENYYHRHKQRE
ncbi:MAG TPA: carbon-nitrogen hydrolase family protein [Anaerolineales bacterium]|nr:carbon-nitrogen hydrolase family protein [Anaerolineales bacterium]